MPILGFFTVFIVFFVVLFKGAKLEPIWLSALISVGAGVVVAIVLFFYAKKRKQNVNCD